MLIVRVPKGAEVEARPRFDAICFEIKKIIQWPGALTPEQVELLDEILPDLWTLPSCAVRATSSPS